MTADQVQEINAFTHVENERIDEAIAKVMAYIEKRGWGDDVDVVFTTDHGEFQAASSACSSRAPITSTR